MLVFARVCEWSEMGCPKIDHTNHMVANLSFHLLGGGNHFCPMVKLWKHMKTLHSSSMQYGPLPAPSLFSSGFLTTSPSLGAAVTLAVLGIIRDRPIGLTWTIAQKTHTRLQNSQVQCDFESSPWSHAILSQEMLWTARCFCILWVDGFWSNKSPFATLHRKSARTGRKLTFVILC